MSVAAGLIGGEDAMKGTSLAYGMSGIGAAEQNREASEMMAAAQREALDYMKSVEEVPQFYRTAGTEALGMMYGLGGPEGQAEAVEQFKSSPQYGIQLEGLGQAIASGEESILRNQAMTGGLRSGNTQGALAGLNARLTTQANDRALNQYLGGLGGLAGLQVNPEGIANRMTGIADTISSGNLASYQAMQQGTSNVAGLATTAFSDENLKRNITYICNDKGHAWYAWEWNEKAEEMGLKGKSMGVIAQDVQKYLPEAIGESEGYLTVNYQMLRAA